jgi:hypothetical protein
MNPNDQELMERYIYQVIRRLPKEQREEVGLELRELIGDMLEESGSMEEVLTRLGNPTEFAEKYLDRTRYLIGPEYYDTYLWFLKIVLLCTLLPILAVSILQGVRVGVTAAGDNDVSAAVTAAIHGIPKAIGSCIVSCIGAFGGVTLVFAVLERQKIKIDLKNEKAWSVGDLGSAEVPRIWTPQSLAPVPHKKALISRGDSIVGIVFIVIFCILLIIAPQFFAAIFSRDGAMVTIPVFNLDQWHIILPVFILSLLIGLVDEILRLVMGCYCRAVMLSNIVCGVLQMSLSVLVLKVFPFWNPNFAEELQAQAGERLEWAAAFAAKWDADAVSNGMLALILVITLLEIGTTIYKTLRYGVERKSYGG